MTTGITGPQTVVFGIQLLNMYAPLKIKSGIRQTRATTFMAKRGEDLRDLPQLLDPTQALTIQNYIITTDGGLGSRRGLKRLFNIAGTNGITMLEKFTEDIIIFGYSTIVAAYEISTDTVTNIKTNFTTDDPFSGVRYGDYFFVCNKSEKIGRISRTLAYDAQTVNFTVGTLLTGGTSGATATILEDADAGLTGTLTLGNVVGTFVDNEIITGSPTGSATVNGTLTWAYTTVSAAPIAGVLQIIGPRLHAGNLVEDSTAVKYSSVDTGANPPFTDWTVGTLATSAGLVNFRNGGTVRSILPLGPLIVALQDNGKFAFQINTVDSGGTLSKIDQIQLSAIDSGGARGAISTNQGIFYANKAGLWQLIAVAQQNIPYSGQEALQSILLGANYFDDVNLSNADFVYDPKIKTVFLTCAKDSDTNNFVICYGLENKAFFQFNGWNISRFLNFNSSTIYAGSALNNRTYTAFSGFDDDGADIWTTYYQELKMGELFTRQELIDQYIQGFLSASSVIQVAYDIYDVQGNFVPDKVTFNWTPQAGSNLSDGYGIASWGTGAWGGDVDTAGLIECFDGAKGYINNYQRIRLKITAHAQVPHAVNWVSLRSKQKVQIRRRKMVLTSSSN